MDGIWGFDQADDVELDDLAPENSTVDDSELLIGQDNDQTITISVTPTCTVHSVALTRNWRTQVTPDVLQSKATQAVQAATTKVISYQAERTDMDSGHGVGTNSPQATSKQSEDDTPITRDHVLQLLSTVSVDVEKFTKNVSSIATKQITSTSSSGRVTVSGTHQVVQTMSLDTRWVDTARDSAIEVEILDALANFFANSSLKELAQGPDSPAITELMSLVADPEGTLRRIRQRRSE